MMMPSRSGRELAVGEHPFHRFGTDPLEFDLGPVVETSVLQRFDDRQVGVGEFDVLADQADLDGVRRSFDLGDDAFPRRQVDLVVDAQHVAHERVEAFVVENQRQLVDVVGVGGVDDRFVLDVTHLGDLAFQVVRERFFGAAHDHVGGDPSAAQLAHRVLGRLGLLLAGRPDVGHERDVDVADVVASGDVAELADGFQEREDLDVTDGATDLGDDDVDVLLGDAVDAALDLVGDVGDDLDRLAEIGRRGARRRSRPSRSTRWWRWSCARQALVDEALVVAEIEVGLAPVVGDVDTSPCSNGFIVPGSRLMYGSSFCSVTRRPRSLSSRPSDDAVRPFPRELATPPVTKMCLVTRAPRLCGSSTSRRNRNLPRARTSRGQFGEQMSREEFASVRHGLIRHRTGEHPGDFFGALGFVEWLRGGEGLAAADGLGDVDLRVG